MRWKLSSQSDLRANFGREVQSAQSVEIACPSGGTQVFHNV